MKKRYGSWKSCWLCVHIYTYTHTQSYSLQALYFILLKTFIAVNFCMCICMCVIYNLKENNGLLYGELLLQSMLLNHGH